MTRIDWRLCFIADSEAAAGRDVVQLIEGAAAGGATIIQLRGKKWTSREFLEIGIRAAQVSLLRKIPLIINDRVDVALACKAQGVHLGQEDMPLPYAREILGQKRIVGISVSTPEEAQAAEGAGADYVGAGPVFATLSKIDLGLVLGLDGLRKIREKIKIPILAIGGISAANVAEVIRAGADGAAVISAITSAASPRKAASEITGLIEKIRNKKR